MHGALADVTRLHVVDLLAVGDRSASELGAELGIASNLLAHHLKVLEGVGLLSRRRSEGDRRRAYFTLSAHDGAVERESDGGGGAIAATRVVFVCTANTARSHLAAAAWRRVSDVPAASAGTHPGPTVHPGAIAAAQRRGIELPDVAPRALDSLHGDSDLVVTVCDRAHEELGGRDWAHWSVADPVPAGVDASFDEALSDISARVARLAPRVAGSRD